MDILNNELAQSESSTTVTIITKPNFKLDELNFPPLNKSIIQKIVPSLRKYTNILHKIITRLRALQNYNDWFTEDGVLALPGTNLKPQGPSDTTQEHQYPSLFYVKPYHHSKMGLSRIQTTTDNLTVIEIKFGTLTFFHHPLFSVEHFLAQALQRTYNEYRSWQSQEILREIETDLRIIRNTRLKLIHQLSEETGDNQMSIFGDSSIQKYCEKISDLKERRSAENAKLLIYKEKLINFWKDVKLVRNRMKFVNTPVILDIQKTDMDREAVDISWDTDLQWEIDDITTLQKCEYVRKRMEYKHARQVYKESKDSNRSKPSKPCLAYNEEDITEQAANNLKHIYPYNSKYNVNFNLIINESIVDTSIDNDPNETNRRTRLLNSKLAFQLSLDESDVCETKFVNLDNSFVIDFSETISFQILSTNTILHLKLIDSESTLLHEDTVSIPSFDVDIKETPIRKNIFSNGNKVKSSVSYVGSGVHILKMLKPYNITLTSLKHFDKSELINLNGEFKYKIGWSIAPKESKTLCTSLKNKIIVKPDISYYYDLNGAINFEMLRKDFELSIDRKSEMKDLNNQLNDYEEVLSNSHFGELTIKTMYFDIETDNVRTRLLKLRNEHKSSAVKSQRIPIHDKEISPELLNLFNGEDNKDRTILDRLRDGKETEPIDLQRYVSMKYLQNVNEHILQSIQEYTLKRCNQDLVLDYKICGIRNIFSGDFYTLRTSHMARDNNLTEWPLSDRLNLRVTVIRAFRLPERVHSGSKPGGELNLSDQENEAFKVSSLRPVVKLNIQDQSIQTSPAVGCNPTWNQTLNLEIRKNLSSTLTIHLFDEVKENLNSRSESLDGEEGTSTVHYRLAYHWMASLQIPLTGILSQTKIEGTFKMNSPPTILGYSYLNTKRSSRNLALNNEAMLLLQKDEIYITLHISLMPQPRLSLSPSILSNIETSEVEIIEKHLINFANDYSKEFPLRQLHLTYVDTNGKSKCVIRFLQSLSIPDFANKSYNSKSLNRRGSAVSKSSESIQGSKARGRKKASAHADKSESSATPRSSDIWTVESSMFEMKNLKKEDSLESLIEMCLRYVSLVPIFETTNMNGVTLMGSELLRLMCGTPLDHTILLASYFLYLGLQTWVVIGEGRPRGQSCYVMTRYNRRTSRMALISDEIEPSSLLVRHSLRGDMWIYILYDATSGQKYDLRSSFSPLTSIYCVYNDINIWANVQPKDKYENIRLDLTSSADWQAVFEKGTTMSRASVQLEDMLYTEPLPTETLRQRIEDRVRTKIQHWRSQQPTIWNRYCSAILRDSLQHWEMWMKDTLQCKPEPGNRLKQLTMAYNVYGFPLNFPYTNLKTIISAIKATAFCLTEHSGVEFGLAVEVFSYPNSVLSVWVYLARITRK